MRLRQALWRQLDPEAYDREGLSPANKVVLSLVVLSSFIAVVETEPTVEDVAALGLSYAEYLFAVLFLAEYLLRIWVEGENPKFRGIIGRVRYALTPAALIDLAALLPSLVAPGITNLMLLRTLRVMRILRLARLGRFSLAMRHLTEAVMGRREELLLSLMLASLILVFSAAGMYVLEGKDNPEAPLRSPIRSRRDPKCRLIGLFSELAPEDEPGQTATEVVVTLLPISAKDAIGNFVWPPLSFATWAAKRAPPREWSPGRCAGRAGRLTNG
jgi:voltage-gated potassium channel